MRRNNLKTLKVTIENLQQVKNGVVCGTQVAFKVIQAGRVLVEEDLRQDFRSVDLVI
jgi:hypothetical protein